MSLEPESEHGSSPRLEAPVGTNQPTGTDIITHLVIIKAGKFVNHLARISSLMNNRYNLQILTDDGKPKRKEDQSTKSTALVRSGFDVLNVTPPWLVFGSIKSEDLPAILTELNKKREELQLPSYGSEAIQTSNEISSSTNSTKRNPSTSSGQTSGSAFAPASAPGGSPMNKSKLKTKASADEVEPQCAEDGEESRNNLYWAEVSSRRSNARYGYVCLWYGGTSVRFTDTVPVLPISPKMAVYSKNHVTSSSGFSSPIIPSSSSAAASAGGDGSVSEAIGSESGAGGAASAISVASTTPLSGSTSFNELARRPSSETRSAAATDYRSGSADSSDSEDEVEDSSHSPSVLLDVPRHFLRNVRRGDLSPLDEDLVNAKYAHMPENDPYKHFLLAMLAFPEWDYPQRDSYIWPDFAVGLMQNPSAQEHYLRKAQGHPLNNGVRPFSDVILFLLCAEQTGVLDEWSDELYAQDQQCTDGIQYLLESISDFRRTNEDIYRSTCRVADCFQTGDLPAFQKERDPSFDPTAEPVVFSPSNISDRLLEEYLSQVQALRESSLRVNQLIEAPLYLEHLTKEWKAFNATSAAAAAGREPITASSSKHAARTALNEFIAVSRRQNKKLTGLFTVKQPPSPTFAFTSSPQPVADKKVAIVTASSSNMKHGTQKHPASSSESSSSKPSTHGTAPASDMDVVDDVERLIPTTDRVVKTEKSESESVDVVEFTETSSSTSEITGSVSEARSGPNKVLDVTVPVVSPQSVSHRVGEAAGGLVAGAGLASLAAAATTLPERVEEFVVVNHGVSEQKVPLRFCRISTLPEDTALEILHACAYDVPRALQIVAEKLRSGDPDAAGGVEVVKQEPGAAADNTIARVFCKDCNVTLNRWSISSVELDNFHGVVNKFNNDLQSIYTRFNRYLAKQALRAKSLNSNISNLDKAAGPYFFSGPDVEPSKNGAFPARAADGPYDGSDFIPRIMKEILALFFLFYPGLDDERIPLMTTFNSPLFRVSWNNSSIASSVMAYGQNGSSQQLSTLSNKKPGGSNGNGSIGRGRPRLQPRPARNVHLPNRWPPNLPAIQHNLYWLANSNTPCLCTGLCIKPKATEVQLNMITINSEAHRIIVLPNKVVPLNDEVMKRSNDERSVAFASALMQFVDWEFQNHIPATSQLHKWYVYPAFVTQMLNLTSRWMGWRKQAERNPRSATMSRRDSYLHALIEDYLAIPEGERSDRYYNSSYPWDDSPLLEAFGDDESSGEESSGDADGLSGIESFSEREYEDGEDDSYAGEETKRSFGPKRVDPSSSRRPVGRPLKKSSSNSALDANSNSSSVGDEMDLFADQTALSMPKKRGRPSLDSLTQVKTSRSRLSLNSEPEVVEEDPRSKPPPLRSFYNMFWIPRSQLPCLYYDTPENRYTEKFKIIPICCLTYHYPVEVNANTKGSIEPLQMNHLKRISDERTAEFAYALIEFARKENERVRKARLVSELASDSDLVLGGPIGGEFESVDDDTHSLHDASMLQPNELFDWPEFILQLVNQPANWHSWRKKAERSGAGLKRHQYLKALQITQDEYEEKQKVLRISQENEIAAKAAKDAITKKEAPSTPALHIRSQFNLFWLLRSNLPAIYYDSPENRDKDKFTVLPINCAAYQYPMQVKGSAVVIEALTQANLARCTEDRTAEFTLALLDFAKWELADRRAQSDPQRDLYFVSDEAEDLPVTDSAPSDLYDWPDFILQMLNSPEQWSTWRKKAERSTNRGDTKRAVYFKALVEDFNRLLAAATTENGMVVSS